MKIALALLLSSAALAPFAQAATVRYSVIFQGKTNGYQQVSEENGLVTVDYHYRQNGRGPDTHEEIRLDPQGLQIFHRLTGTTTFGAPANETFERGNGIARWQSIVDSGSVSSTARAFYLPVNAALAPYA